MPELVCRCGGTTQVVWSPAFAAHLCTTCLDTQTTAELGEPIPILTAPVRVPAGEAPVAYCAPGRRAEAAVALALAGEQVTDVKEHPWLSGATVYLMGQPVEPADYPLTLPAASPPSCFLRNYSLVHEPHPVSLLPGLAH